MKKRRRYEAMAKDGRLPEQFVHNALISWFGYASFADSYKLIKKLRLGSQD
ncbi:MAG: hypothetical protein NTW60_01205 [Candidatus Wolfebacteria bacterium]|nr:hypothetical protein [Candidatus Wolfebacteria bacterium]